MYTINILYVGLKNIYPIDIYILYYVCVMTRSAPIPVTSKDYAATAAVSRADTTSPFNSTRSTKSTKPSTAVACLSPSSSVQSLFVNKK